MANGAPSMAALKQIGDILYGLKAHPQFQTEITNAAMEMRIHDPAALLALIDERLHGQHPAKGREEVTAATPAPSAEVVAALSESIPRAGSGFMASASVEGVDNLVAPTFPDMRSQDPSAFVPNHAIVAEPTPIAHTTGFMATASLGVDQFRPPELPDVRPRSTEQSNDSGNSRA